MKKAVQILLVAAIGLLSASILSAATINVPGPYGPTIQAAINAALPGDVIQVAAGAYPEQLSINKALTIQGGGIGIGSGQPEPQDEDF